MKESPSSYSPIEEGVLSRLQESPRSSSCLRDIPIQRQRADAPSYAMTAAAWRKCCAATTTASGVEVRAGNRSHCSMWQARNTALFPRQAKRSLGAAHLYNIVWAAMGVGVPSGRATDWTISGDRGPHWCSPLPSKWFDQPEPPPDSGTSHKQWELVHAPGACRAADSIRSANGNVPQISAASIPGEIDITGSRSDECMAQI